MTAQQEKDWQKRVKWDNVHLQTLDNFEDNSYLLTERQANALLNVIKQMKWASRWDDSISLDEIDEFASEIAYRLTYPSGCGDCTEYPAWASLIEWFPQNPYTEPDLVPDGYVFPPFYVAGDVAASVYDAELNSVITSIERLPTGTFPFPIPASGWPRFRVNVNGTGTVEMHFANINWGSLIQVQVDNDLLSLVWVDTNQDQFAIPPESANRTIVERVFTTEGDHWIDCTIVPMVDDEAPFVTYGGGLIKVVLCGFNPPYEGTGSDLMGLAMRLNAQCEMEFSIDEGDTWEAVQDWVLNANNCFLGDTGAAGLDGAAGADGDDGLDGADGAAGADGDDGQTANEFPPQPDPDTDEMCGAAWYIAEQMEALIQDAIVDAASITLEEFLVALLGGGGFDGSLLVLFWDWLVVTVDATLAANITVGMDFVAEHLYCTSLDIDATKLLIAADTVYSANARTGWQMAFDSMDVGKIALWSFVGAQDTTRDCSSFCDTGIRLEGGGNDDMSSFSLAGEPAATYNPVSDTYVANHLAACDGVLWDVRFTFAVPTLISAIEWDYAYNRTAGVDTNLCILSIDSVDVDTHTLLITGLTDRTLNWTGSQLVTEIRIIGGINEIGCDGSGEVQQLRIST